MLQSILERAAEWGHIQRNPARYVRKPQQPKGRKPRALSPRQIESLRLHFLKKGEIRNASLVTMLAYAGLRPGEALALRWGDIKNRSTRPGSPRRCSRGGRLGEP
jgi:integrase